MLNVIPILFLLTSMQGKAMNNIQQETPEQKNARMQWWREARFGLFIHWGLYAIPGGQWKDETSHGEWIRETARIPLDEYKQFLHQFNPINFNASEWVSIAKQAGMKYIVITSKHHDGFALFDSKVSDFDVMSTPFQRDIMKELAEEARKQELKICWYHSIMDWNHPDYLPRRSWENRSTEGADFNRFVSFLRVQVTELLTNYGEIGVMWFDGEWEQTWNHTYGKQLYELCRSLQPNVIVNNRVDVGREGMGGMTKNPTLAGDFGTPEQEVPATGLPGMDWETCMTMNNHWGYNKFDNNYKSTKQLIRILVDVVSKGGNFLLNVGPTADGRFPEESIKKLKEIGDWMQINGEAIYKTTQSPFKKLDWGRCTVGKRNGTTVLYLHVFDVPQNRRLHIPGLSNTPKTAYRLADKQNYLTFEKIEDAIIITLPDTQFDENCEVIVLEIEGEPVVYTPPSIQTPSYTFYKPITVNINSQNYAEIHYTFDGTEPSETSPIFKQPITITETTVIKARCYKNGKPVSPTETVTLTKAKLLSATKISDAYPRLICKIYEGDWNTLPDFSNLTSFRETLAEKIFVPEYEKKEYEGRKYMGYIFVHEDDVYEFALTSDDGAKLYINDKLVINNDGLHVATTKNGFIALEKGMHNITVDWFNKTGIADLKLEWTQLGGQLQEVSPNNLFHSK